VRPTSSTSDSAPGQALGELADALAAIGYSADALAQATDVATLVNTVTNDPALTQASLLHIARQFTPNPPALPAALRSRCGSITLGLTEQLTRLGDFRLDAQWDAGQALQGGQAETVRKMLLAVVGDPRLVVARLAEELVLARQLHKLPAAARRRQALAIQELYAPLANRLGVWMLKWELEDLAFKALHPDEYQHIAKTLNEKRRDRERYIAEVLATLSVALKKAGIAADVQGRAKHIYSIYRKMQKKKLAFEEMFDIRAARIIVHSVADCYAALGIVHDLWPILPNEFDDYIATPKQNDYRSIHTAVSGPDGRPLEVQIRTQQMQDQAELGVSAHWRYKEGGNGNAQYEQKIQQVRELLQGQGAAGELGSLGSGLFSDRIYAMTPKGEVVDLPRGATPLDFAFHVHSSLGERCKGARVNGRIAPLTQAISSGDVVEIITGKQAAPSRDWLSASAGFLVSSRSKSKLRAYFRRLDEQAAGTESTTTAATTIATAQLPAAEVPPRATQPRKPKAIQSSRSPVEIDGVGDLPITLARCCAPVRPQEIRGYLTLGRGVTIHRVECPGLARMVKQKPQRLLKVEWTVGDAARIAAKIEIDAFDRRGLLRDISDLIAEEHLSIEGVSSNTDPNDRVAHFEVRLTVRDASELSKLQRRLARIPNVFKVRRAK
jgi:GTP pyrophosphokinase